jgi:hypothetical protein
MGKHAADNISRYLRIERLRTDVAEFLQSTIDYSEKLETDSPHWEYVFDEYARITGYENSDDLAADANFWALQANQSFADGLQAYNELEEAHNTRRMGEKISSIIAVSSFMGSVGMRTYAKVKYGANCEWHTYMASEMCTENFVDSMDKTFPSGPTPRRWWPSGLDRLRPTKSPISTRGFRVSGA